MWYNNIMRNWTVITATTIAAACASVAILTPAAGNAHTAPIVNSGVTQTNSGWALASFINVDDISSENFWYPNDAGKGATVYIVDSGVANDSKIFDNVTSGFNALNSDSSGSANTDCTNHGTQVASVVAGELSGLAKHATVVPVKVGECEETYDNKNIISGLEWVKANPPANGSTGIVNLSFGFMNDDYYNDEGLEAEVQSLIDAGFFVTVSAGNDSGEKVYDSCNETPARIPGVFTVGAYTSDDEKLYRSEFSNSGSCVDIWAPGGYVNTEKTSESKTATTATVSGTSFAAPFVAGLSAMLVGVNPAYTAAELEEIIKEHGVAGKLIDNAKHPLNANISYVTDSNNVYNAQAVANNTINLIAQLPVEVPDAPEKTNNLQPSRFYDDAVVSWGNDSSIKNSAKISYIVAYALVDEEGFIKTEGKQITTSDTQVTLHGLSDKHYAYKVTTVNNGRMGESTGWIEIPVVSFWLFGKWFA